MDSESAYSYLLGIYLGDGYVHPTARSARLLISMDAAFPGLVEECVAAIGAVAPVAKVSVRRHPQERVVTISSYWKGWLPLFPQWGPGKKHTRPIVLEAWQREIVAREPAAFIRGLIHSDGCRTINRFETRLPSGRTAEYKYVRYFFSNLSEDIRDLFCETCEKLDLRWTQSNSRNISIAHRDSVDKLEQIVGPKR